MKLSSHLNLRRLTVTAIMSAVSFVLMVLEFSVPFLPSFLKFDFSDLPAFITSFAIGPVYGICVELIKNVLHLTMTTTSGVGELANFIIGGFLVLPAGIIYKCIKTRKGAVIGSFAGAVAAALISVPVNYFITYPFYFNFMPKDTIIAAYSAVIPSIDSLIKALIYINLPFTLCKGIINSIITFFIYKKLSPILKGGNK